MPSNASLMQSSVSSAGCTCILSSWEHCLEITGAQGGFACHGGDRHGDPCEGESDRISCEGENSGRCRGGKRARMYPNVQGLPTRAHPIKFREQDVDWTDLPGLSATVPLQLNTRTNLPFRRGTDITSFEKDDSTYLALSLYVDPDTNFRSTSSVLFRVREIKLSMLG